MTALHAFGAEMLKLSRGLESFTAPLSSQPPPVINQKLPTHPTDNHTNLSKQQNIARYVFQNQQNKRKQTNTYKFRNNVLCFFLMKVNNNESLNSKIYNVHV